MDEFSIIIKADENIIVLIVMQYWTEESMKLANYTYIFLLHQCQALKVYSWVLNLNVKANDFS